MRMKLITQPLSEPVSVSELKTQLRIEHSEDDAYLFGLIVAARQYAEKATGNVFITQTWDIPFTDFSSLEIPIRPIKSIESITYVDTDGNNQTLSDSVYFLDDYGFRAHINLGYGEQWPSIRDQKNAVIVRVVAGANQAPQSIKHAVILMAAHWYENREETSMDKLKPIPLGAERLLTLDENRYF